MKVENNYRIKLPNDSIVNYPVFYKHVPISISGIIFLRDLIQFDLSDFDIILGMNWLCTYRAKIDCKELKVILNDEKGREVCFFRKREEKLRSLISAMKASKFIEPRVYWVLVLQHTYLGERKK